MIRQLSLTALVWPFFLCSLTVAAEDTSISDAALHDVQFVDARHGWAVGDRGAIWHTDNGGASWQLQPSGAVCSLNSVSFVNEKTGWIAGGQSLPYSPLSSGLVLGTWDGGLSWQLFSWQQFPRLHGIQFLSGKSGWAWGEASELYPSALLRSDNAGRLWQPATGSASQGWLAGHVSGPDRAVLGGPGGSVVEVSNGVLNPVTLGSFGLRSIRRIKSTSDGTVWAVGDGGLVLRSDTRGVSWSLATGGIPTETQAIFDWRGVHAIARSVWIVGRPGSVVMCSTDSGTTWHANPTGQTVPLEAVWFQDPLHGWAVGSLGTILATDDGGQSWRVQRRGGERAALMAVHGEGNSAPLLTHAQLGADQGYLCVDLAMAHTRHDGDESPRAATEWRLADAIAVAGGTQAECEWRFPANPLALSLNHVLADWNSRREGKAMKELERRLVVAIRVWRPEVIVADSPDPAESPDPATALVSQALERAFQSAADRTAFPELLSGAQLEPWNAKKLFAATRQSRGAIVRIDSSELSRATGKPLDNQSSLSISLLAESYRAPDSEIRYRLVASRLPPNTPDNSLMAGIVLEPGGPARRKLAAPVEISDAQRRTEQTRRNLLALVDRTASQPLVAHQLTPQLDVLLKELSPEESGNVIYGLARKHFEQGRWLETRDLLEKLLKDYPQHLSAPAAYRWLIQFYASSEVRHREQLAGMVAQASYKPFVADQKDPSATVTPVVRADSSDDRANTKLRFSSNEQTALVGRAGSDVPWAKGSVETAKRLLQVSPLCWSDPAVQFPVAAAQRQLGNLTDADRFYTAFALGRQVGAWSDAARGERWIRDHQGIPSKPVLVSYRATAPPHLDAVLDDPVWKAAAPISLTDPRQAAAGWETEARVAHDHQFLYVALTCRSPAGESILPVRPRQHDMDLAAQDRIHLYLDLDRDYATYYHLAVDVRGGVLDDCWGDRTWDPTWYVASQSDEHGYCIEAAIPLAELTDTPVQEGTVWAFNAVRIVPGQRIMAWSKPAGLTPRPEGLGYLLFRDGPVTPLPRRAVAN